MNKDQGPFKTGDKVRIKSNGWAYESADKEYTLVKFDGSWLLDGHSRYSHCYQSVADLLPVPQPFKIEVGKWYKTRDGQIADKLKAHGYVLSTKTFTFTAK